MSAAADIRHPSVGASAALSSAIVATSSMHSYTEASSLIPCSPESGEQLVDAMGGLRIAKPAVGEWNARSGARMPEHFLADCLADQLGFRDPGITGHAAKRGLEFGRQVHRRLLHAIHSTIRRGLQLAAMVQIRASELRAHATALNARPWKSVGGGTVRAKESMAVGEALAKLADGYEVEALAPVDTVPGKRLDAVRCRHVRHLQPVQQSRYPARVCPLHAAEPAHVAGPAAGVRVSSKRWELGLGMRPATAYL